MAEDRGSGKNSNGRQAAMRILVTGGAGYVGSHTCKLLASQGHVPVVVDNLVYGHEWAVQWGPFYKLDIFEKEKIVEVLKKEKIEAVLHFAAFAYVGESVKNPYKYYHNNVLGTMSLLEAMKEAGVLKIVFSSTCATYGEPEIVPIPENCTQSPINPYGHSKLMVETILQDYARAYGLSAVCLRYFNACGADVDLQIGEAHNPETHLIPLALQAAYEEDKSLTIFGTDYETEDGTCIRDYIHVMDLAAAHVLALSRIQKNGIFEAYNVGTGNGLSVFQIVSAIEKIAKRQVKRTLGLRRAGDPPRLIANSERAFKELGWKPVFSDVENIIATAHGWHVKHFLKK